MIPPPRLPLEPACPAPAKPAPPDEKPPVERPPKLDAPPEGIPAVEVPPRCVVTPSRPAPELDSAEPPPATNNGTFPALRTTNVPPPEPPAVPEVGAAPV
jgi:hypothetical protein